MKRILILILALSGLLAFSSCAKDENTRTYCFYNEINKSSFFFACEITEDGETYRYAQAVTNKTVTTIEDHDDNTEDGYAICELNRSSDGRHFVHSLNFNTSKYDTTVTADAVKFVFGDYEAVQFRAPDESEEEIEFNGGSYYCEIFETVDANGDEVGLNKYYFDGMKLVGIEWIENDEVVRTMVFTEYRNEIPESVYTSVPDGFKAGTFTEEQVIPPRQQ